MPNEEGEEITKQSGLKIDLQDGTFDAKGRLLINGGQGSEIHFGDPTDQGSYFEVTNEGKIRCKGIQIYDKDGNEVTGQDGKIKIENIGKVTSADTANALNSTYLKADAAKVELKSSPDDTFTAVTPEQQSIITAISLSTANEQDATEIDLGAVEINLGTEEEPNNKTIQLPKLYLKLTTETVWVFKE